MESLNQFAVDVLRVYFHRGFAAAQSVAHSQDVASYVATRFTVAQPNQRTARPMAAATEAVNDPAAAPSSARRTSVSIGDEDDMGR